MPNSIIFIAYVLVMQENSTFRAVNTQKVLLESKTNIFCKRKINIS